MYPQVITLDCEIFTEFLNNMDTMLRIMLSQMKEKGLTEAELTGKIKATTGKIKNGGKVDNLRFEPDVQIKMGAKGKMDCGIQDGLVIKLNDRGLPVVASNQVSMDEFLAAEE